MSLNLNLNVISVLLTLAQCELNLILAFRNLYLFTVKFGYSRKWALTNKEGIGRS